MGSPPTPPADAGAGDVGAASLQRRLAVELARWRTGVEPRRAARRSAADGARERIAALAVPPGSLGRLGELAVEVARARGGRPQDPRRVEVLVLAGDHGIHARGVSPWPQSLSATVAGAIADGRAAINAIARATDTRVVVVDAGLAAPLPGRAHPAAAVGNSTDRDRHATIVSERAVVRATRDPLASADGLAMTRDEVADAILTGATLAAERIAGGTELLALGDVGLANTTTSAAIVAALTGHAPASVTGRGSGIDDETLALKVRVVTELVRGIRTPTDALEVLARIGGAEHAVGVGVLLEANAQHVPVVLDGLISASTALLAASLVPDVPQTLIAGHRSPEPGADLALTALDLSPVLELGMRVGEGTGAVVAVASIRAALRLFHDVITLEDLLGATDRDPVGD